MQRVWVTVLSVWAMLAIVAVLAWSHRPAQTAQPRSVPQTLVVRTPNGKRQIVVLQPGALGASHATTQTSGAPR